MFLLEINPDIPLLNRSTGGRYEEDWQNEQIMTLQKELDSSKSTFEKHTELLQAIIENIENINEEIFRRIEKIEKKTSSVKTVNHVKAKNMTDKIADNYIVNSELE